MPVSGNNYKLIIDKEFSSGSLSKASDSFKQHFPDLDVMDVPELNHIQVLSGDIEPHVVDALKYAQAFDPKVPIKASTALQAVIFMARKNKAQSKAYMQLFFLLSGADEERFKSTKISNINSYLLDEHFGRSIKFALEQINKQKIEDSLWGRDFITAAILCYNEKSLNELALNSGISLEELQDRWYQFLNDATDQKIKRDWNLWWKYSGIPLPADRRTRAGYLPESLTTNDKLDIEKETRALAEIISDENIIPPLSIGLIGDWGSGKSFFMTKIEDHVKKFKGQPGFCKNIAIVKFNAWHVSDANLWASIVDHIFTEIWKCCSKNENDIQNARFVVNKQLQEAKGALFESEKQLEYLNNCLKDAVAEQDRINTKYALNKFIDENHTRVLNKVVKAIGWEKPLKSFKDIESALSEIEDSYRKVNSIFGLAFSGKCIKSAIPWIALVVLLAAIGLFIATKINLISFKNFIQQCSVIGALAGTILSFIAAPLLKANSLIKKFADNLQETINKYKGKESENVIKIRNEYLSAHNRIEYLSEKIKKLEKDKYNLDPFERLSLFIEERANSETYRSQQGIVSLVRRDFETLSDLMRDWIQNRKTPPSNVEPVDRIILYIDDLDRCSPGIVVQTLEAIHLLLALDLFVVIVGVDSRWLLRSLDVHYSTLLSAREGEDEDEECRISTPHNYLEKIFQITYAVSPMRKSGFCNYVEYLAGNEAVLPFRGTAGAASQNTDIVEQSQSTMVSSTGEAVGETESSISGEFSGDSNKGILNGTPNDGSSQNVSKIRSLSITKNEKEYLKKLYPFILTPRIAKKITNVYRIIKAKTLLSDLDSLEEKEGRHEAILMLLAILFNYPQISEKLFKSISERTISPGSRNLKFYNGLTTLSDSMLAELKQSSEFQGEIKGLNMEFVGDLQKKCKRIQAQASELKKISKLVESVDSSLTLVACEKESVEVSRYSLVTGQVWHTWQIPQNEKQ